MNYFGLILIILISFPIFAQTSKTSTLTSAQPNSPKMPLPFADHAEDGCPSNSYCSPLAGNERKKWIAFMDKLTVTGSARIQRLEEFRKKTGIPLTAWINAERQKDKDIISWDSRCLHHQKEGNVYFQAEILAPALATLKERKLVLDQTYTIIKDNVVRTYVTPREEYPLYLDGDDLVFLREEEGSYYALKITPAGLGEIIEASTLASDDYPTEIKCPDALINFAKEREKGRNLYIASPFCKQIKNIKTKENQIFLFNKSCNQQYFP